MFWIMLILWIAILAVHILYFLSNKDDKWNRLSVVLALVCAAVYFLAMLDQPDSTGTGAYAYYVNGVRVSSGGMAFGKNLMLSLFGGVMTNFTIMGLAYLILMFPALFSLRVGKWLENMGICLLISGIVVMTMGCALVSDPNNPLVERIFLLIGIAATVLGILALIVYKKFG